MTGGSILILLIIQRGGVSSYRFDPCVAGVRIRVEDSCQTLARMEQNLTANGRIDEVVSAMARPDESASPHARPDQSTTARTRPQECCR